MTRIWNLVVSLVVLILLAFSIAALRQVLAHPPPDELHVVPADYDPKKDVNPEL